MNFNENVNVSENPEKNEVFEENFAKDQVSNAEELVKNEKEVVSHPDSKKMYSNKGSKKMLSARSKRKDFKSMVLVGNETVDEYFKRINNERLQKKDIIQREIEEQKLSFSTIFPVLHLRKQLKDKWFRVRNKLKLHVSMVKSHKEIKLYGININGTNKIKEAVFDDESAKKIIYKKTLFHTGSKFKSIWGFILFALLMYTAYVTPIQIAFIDTYSEPLKVLEYMVNTLFILDMIVTMNSSYYDSNNQLVQNRGKIIKKYLKGWFFIDFLAAFPFEMLETDFLKMDPDSSVSFRSMTGSNFQQLLKLPRLYRLFRLARFVKMIKKTKKSIYLTKIQEMFRLNSGFISVINYLIILSVAINFVGCIWFFEAKIRGFEPETWVYELNLVDETDFVLYTYSIYWAIQTLCTVGYGDIHAFNMMERLLCIIWMSFGAGFYSYSVGALSSIITDIDTRKAKLRKKRIIMDEFCKENGFSKILHLKIRKSLEYAVMKSLFTVDEKMEFLRELPSDLKFEISKITREKMLINFPFFKNKDKGFIAEFVLFLSPLRVPAGELIFEKGQYPNSVYFLINGRVGLIEGHEKTVYKYFVPGGYFGEIEVFADSTRIATAQASTDCELLTIDRHEFLLILNNFPEIKNDLKKVSLEKMNRIEENLKNVQQLLPLSKKSTFWFKRRKTIRTMNNISHLRMIEATRFQSKGEILKNYCLSFFLLFSRMVTLIFRKNISKIDCAKPNAKLVQMNQPNSPLSRDKKMRNQSIFEYLGSLKHNVKFTNTNQVTNEYKKSIVNDPHKGILKQSKTSIVLKPELMSLFAKEPLLQNLPGEKINSNSKIKSKPKSLPEIETSKKDFLSESSESSISNKEVEQNPSNSSSLKKSFKKEKHSFLLIEKKQEIFKGNFKEKLEIINENWNKLEEETDKIARKLEEANNQLLRIKNAKKTL